MEQDKFLKELLVKGAEIASTDFTDNVMKKVNETVIRSLYYTPLVSDKIKKAFILAFSVLTFIILALCLAVSSAKFPFTWIYAFTFQSFAYDKIIVFIFLFWTLFLANTVVIRTFKNI